MKNAKHNWIKRSLAMLLVVVSLLQWVPADAVATALESSRSVKYTPGDVNDDGYVNALDVNLTRRYIAGGYNVTIHTVAADVNNDGVIDAEDVNILRQHITGGHDVALNPREELFTVQFETAGGSAVESRLVKNGAVLETLPSPYKEGYVFLGWYYDSGYQQAVSSADTVTQDTTLYAAYLQADPLEYFETQNFVGEMDVSPNFTIGVVSSDKSMTAEMVQSAITAEELTDPNKTDHFYVTGSNGAYVIHGRNDNGAGVSQGFAEGSTYRITLKDSRLSFKNQSETAREYNFTTKQDEVMNIRLQGDVIFIPAKDLKNITNDGKSVSSLNIALYDVNRNGEISAADLTTGTFQYSGELHVGDIVSVYEGLIPTERTLDTPKDQLGDLAYLEITAVSGNTYTYVNAQPEDILFEPDVLPIPDGVDLDNSITTLTVENKYLDFSDDVYSSMELDSQTTVDVGDFIVFYTGTIGVTEGEETNALAGYGKITAVKDNGNGTTTITYVSVTWEDVESSMDIYAHDEMSADDMLKGVDIAAMESEIAQQAIDSGFAEEAAQYMASLALATENFTELSENINLEDYKVTLSDGTPISPEELQLMAGSVEVKSEMAAGYPKVTISKRPKHLGDIKGTDADQQGLAIKLELKTVVTISKSGSNKQLQITITGEFVEELGIDISAKSKTEWCFKYVIPYISAYKLNANVDVINYTAISFNATMVTKEAGGIMGVEVDIADEIKGLLEQIASGEAGEEETEAANNNLMRRYSEMVKAESDWIGIVEQNVADMNVGVPPALPIIRFGYAIDFVVELDAAVSIGFDFEYLEGKRYTFSVNITKGTVSSDTIVLKEETYEFSFYAMGRLGIKAGLQMDFYVALIDKKVANVGFEAAAGPYAKLWGYFYYELQYAASKGKSQKYSGALLIEVGAFFDLNLKAEALGGKLATEKSLLEKQWPLWSVGVRQNVQDFSTPQSSMPEIILKQHVRSAMIADNTFLMDYLDLVDGEGKSAIYSDWRDPNLPESETNKSYFVIEMTNDKFSYDPQTNTIQVHPEEEDKKLVGEMIITWIKQPMTFTSKPIQRRVSLYWDNLRDGYIIVPVSNGGTYIPLINKKYEAPVTAPEDPVKQGYVFDGWYSDEALTVSYTFPETMPDTDAYIFAKWAPATDTPYTVEHYKEKFQSGEYELAETECFTGTTDSYVTPAVKDYTGFHAPAKQELKILPDGSAVLRYYYSLQRHTVSFKYGEVDGDDVVYELKYGASVFAPNFSASGYEFAGWSVNGTSVVTPIAEVGEQDVTYTALWKKLPDTSYRVEYYVQQVDGKYALQHMIEAETFTDTVLKETELRNVIIEDGKTADEFYIIEDAVVAENMTVKGIVCTEATVDGSGKTVIKINYKRVIHGITFDLNYPGAQPIVKELAYGAEVVAPQGLTRTGYSFVGWSVDGTTAVTPAQTMGTDDITYKALWQANQYTVCFHAGSDGVEGTMTELVLTYDQAQNLTANAFTKTNYTFAGWALQADGGVKLADGESVCNLTAEHNGVVNLYAVWTPEVYTIGYEGVADAIHTNPETYTVESATITLRNASKTGYTFVGWYDNASLEGDAVTQIDAGSAGNITLYAKWDANTDTAYQIAHYQQQLDGSYLLVDTDHLTGTTDTTVTPAVKSYTGFTAPAEQCVTIRADGSLVVTYQYIRNSYTIIFDANGGAVEPDSITAKYGETITIPVPVRDGYGFNGWYNGESLFGSATMGAENLTLVADWIAGQINYTVNHYQQNVNGEGYTLVATVNSTAAMDETLTPAQNSYEGFTAEGEPITITVQADATQNVVNYYYTRNQYNLTWNMGDGNADGQSYTVGTVYYGAAITAPVPVKTGYGFTWDATSVATMPAEDLTYTAVWMPMIYTIGFNTNGGTVVSGDAAQRNVTFDTQYGELAVLEKNGYEFDGWYDGENKISETTVLSRAADHVLEARFTPISFAISYNNVEDAIHANPANYNIESGNLLLTAAEKTGYNFAGWYLDEQLTEEISVIANGSTGNKVLYAKWAERNYTVIFHSNTGAGISVNQTFTYTEQKALAEKPADFLKDGYHFIGWATTAEGDVAYTNQQSVSRLSDADQGIVHLYAVWAPTTYAIHYENMEGAVNAQDNPQNFSVANHVFVLHEPSKTGYTFNGWYLDAELTDRVEGQITLDSYHEWTFYAKWTANQYLVLFDSCLGTEVPTDNMLMTYDVPATLTLFEDITIFTNPGYTFKGWATTRNGGVAYEDGAYVTNLSAQQGAIVTLYAVWEVNVFNITYDLGTGASANNSANPATYTIEDGDVKLEAPTAKTGFQFLGWYSGETLVTEIVRGTQADYALTAKWAHGGTFTLAYTSYKNVSGGREVTYTVTRTLPEGAVATPNPQIVYVRTVNGTAYGNTPEAATATGQDKYHFVHVDPVKEGSGIVTFGERDMSKTVVIKEADEKNTNNMIASFQMNDTARYYNVELYKVLDTVGGCQGQLGSEKSVKRTLPVSYYKISSSLYNWKSKNLISGEITITDDGYEKNDWRDVYPSQYMNAALSDNQEIYRDLTTSYYGFCFTLDVAEINDGYQWMKVTDATNRGGAILADYVFVIKDGKKDTSWHEDLPLPRYSQSVDHGNIEFDQKKCKMEQNWTMKSDGSHYYALVDKNKNMSICFDAAGDDDDNWKYRDLNVYLKVYDDTAPYQIGMAPLALTQYKAGEQISLTVVYSEIISSTSGIGFKIPSALPIKDVKFVGGAYTNALTFTATVTKDFEVTPNLNNTLVNNTKPVTGTVKDVAGN